MTGVPAKHYISLVGGGRYYFRAPERYTPDIENLAKALSHICRFTGQCTEFYSVAQHSVLVSKLAARHGHGYALEGLLHDAEEGLVGDVSTPLKQEIGPEYKVLAGAADRRIRRYFGVPEAESWQVVLADRQALLAERKVLLPHVRETWTVLAGVKDPMVTVRPQSSRAAERAFLKRFAELTRQEV